MARIKFSNFQIPILLSFVVLLGFLINSGKSQSFDEGKELVIVRKIGHEVLLHVGNTTSRVLPVKRITPQAYQIEFEHPFSFQPDSLIQVVNKVIEEHDLPSEYIVNVIDCSDESIVYAYAVLERRQDDIMPCAGREQPKKCYRIHLQFAEASQGDLLAGYIPGSLALLAGFVVLFMGIRTYQQTKNSHAEQNEDEELPGVKLGMFRFSADEQFLLVGDEKIMLTGKETKLLQVFVKTPGRTLDRDVLQQEVWGNEGVIVGRSLDMFISKLRKKLSSDPNIKLVNIHGKGYKLEIRQG